MEKDRTIIDPSSFVTFILKNTRFLTLINMFIKTKILSQRAKLYLAYRGK